MTAARWSEIRGRMLLDPAVINLNTGSFGPLPWVVFERVTALRRRLAEAPMDFLIRATPPLLWQARERLADLLGAAPQRLAFMANVTAAINTVAHSLSLKAPGEILLSDREYLTMRWCWDRAAQRQGLTIRTYPLPLLPETPDAIVAAVREALTEHTRLLFFSHVLSATGLVLPARALCALARQHGVLTVIDGAHAPALLPVELDALGCDFYGGNCHKWLLAPTGAGFLYFGPGSAERLQPLMVSWGYHYDKDKADERDQWGSTPRLRSFEFEGTRDPCPWLAVPAAIDFQQEIGWQSIRGRIAELTAHVRRCLAEVPDLRLATPAHADLHTALTAFWLPADCDAAVIRRALWERYRIEIVITDWLDGHLLRVSTHFYNTEAEVERLAAALRELLARACHERGRISDQSGSTRQRPGRECPSI